MDSWGFEVICVGEGKIVDWESHLCTMKQREKYELGGLPSDELGV